MVDVNLQEDLIRLASPCTPADLKIRILTLPMVLADDE